MTPGPFLASWTLRCAAVPLTLSMGHVVASGDHPDGPVRLIYSATGLPVAAPLTPEDRRAVRAALESALAGRRAA